MNPFIIILFNVLVIVVFSSCLAAAIHSHQTASMLHIRTSILKPSFIIHRDAADTPNTFFFFFFWIKQKTRYAELVM